jgi:hypothetical protein
MSSIKVLCVYGILLDVSSVCSLGGATMTRAVREKGLIKSRLQVRGLASISRRALEEYDEEYEDEDEDMGT